MGKKKDAVPGGRVRVKPEVRDVGEIPPPRKPVLVTVKARGEGVLVFKVYGQTYQPVLAAVEKALGNL